MIGQAPPEHTCSLQAPPDTTSGEGGPREHQRLLPEPQNPIREVRFLLHNAPAVKRQESLANVQLEALDIRADADYEDDSPAIDLSLWYRHACRPYLVNFTTGQLSYEVERITQDAEELRNWIKEDLLRTGRALFTLEFDESKRIKVQEQQRVAKFGLRRRLFHMIFKKRVRQHDTLQGQQSLDETGSVRSDESGSSWDTANSNSSQTSESAMNDTEQSCAQLLRDVEEARLQIPKDLAVLVLWKQEIKDLQNALQKLEDSLKMHQGNARQIGFSKSG
ncbi:hypothetical protein TGAM01_v202134 [Trichoderma gamsii]|uniref:Uncharacterized protein n=1 Tax=Trichoderma gamsii TaxID=398673 RepID=A0A2P4ZXM5_9HYPO|nr:hypothetical protein TGAM01_v202134 [Trichoderma gamsii]PON29026.1 hypothetical protein TGAM01_v202134 [Trichoderma gamsii]